MEYWNEWLTQRLTAQSLVTLWRSPEYNNTFWLIAWLIVFTLLGRSLCFRADWLRWLFRSRSHTARRRRHAIPSHTAHGRLAGIMIVKPGDVKQHGQVWLWHGWNCRFGATPQVTLYQHYWYNLMHQFTALYSRSQYAYRFYYEFNFSDVEISKVILTLESHRSREHWCV